MRSATRLTLVACLLASLLSSSSSAMRCVIAAPAFIDCEGDACASVTLAFDETKQQYRAQNNSTDHWARVTASNLAASASACLGPGKDAYLPLKSVVGTYHAEYAEARCGEPSADR